ncbi:MAG: glycosyltransferase [Candidatus Thermoplasmatota archaeon]|nr:glycosyltransferase [Candidatus Thermoplasmatota archaeon]
MEATPGVATVIPTWQESEHIERCLRSFMQQTYPSDSHQILVLDGGSTDGTLEIVRQLSGESENAGGPEIILIENPHRFVPHARNLALEYLRDGTELILEMIGHAWVPPDHIEVRVQRMLAIESEIGRELGGLGSIVIESDLPLPKVGKWVESTLSCPLGGSGQFARFKKEGPTKIPPFTLYRRVAIESVGGWNEEYITTQDSEINLRLIDNGWPLWRTANTHVRMAKRKTIQKWWKMGYRYGFWRMKHLIDAKSRMRIGEFLPWIGLAIVIGLAIDGQSTFHIPNFLWPIIAYITALIAVGAIEAKRANDSSMLFGVPYLLLLLHSSFSIGLLAGLFRPGKPPNDRV